MLLLSHAIIKMGSISWEQMSRGLLAMAGALGAITAALILMPNSVFFEVYSLDRYCRRFGNTIVGVEYHG